MLDESKIYNVQEYERDTQKECHREEIEAETATQAENREDRGRHRHTG